ncbi:MAG: endolytic transglycosylase MltG [Candidatus Liberibacter europaeus]|uniref:Endolytic murein transglycosylase n=1 Tax=Candidatus Liberibacter europaeus TaxID=744859 RepID=A0A2T4VXH9_9HYPH|nr:endolytic transglycosylase MltG [Candidatus Liberibacter europaeus]PTL86487.1 MAG: endolytic transglycosylase MltG [Candidatus Liberibacter europaeus]
MLLIVLIFGIGFYYYAIISYNKKGPLEINSIILIRNGMSLRDISNDLFRNGMIDDLRIFHYVTRFRLGSSQVLKAGEYKVEAGSSMSQIAEQMTYGKIFLHSISFPEGFTVKQIFQRLKDNPFLVGELPSELPREGCLCPNTYLFPLGTHRLEIIEQAILAQKKIVDDVWANRNTNIPIKNKEDLVILASIVEKETSRADERSHIAAVFINRLLKGIRLQSDSTIAYDVCDGNYNLLDRRINHNDVIKKTPYNSYMINGLPPTAISNPSRLSLEAVANPLQSDDLYFVSDGMGGHLFSKSLQDHNVNVKKLRKLSSE